MQGFADKSGWIQNLSIVITCALRTRPFEMSIFLRQRSLSRLVAGGLSDETELWMAEASACLVVVERRAVLPAAPTTTEETNELVDDSLLYRVSQDECEIVRESVP